MTTFWNFRDLMRQTIQHEPRTSDDSYGQPTYGERTERRCRVSAKPRLVRDSQGREVVSSQALYLMDDAPVGPQDLITLSTSDTLSTESAMTRPPILSVARSPDERGRIYVTVYLA